MSSSTARTISANNIDFLKALNKYIPSLVLQQLVTRSEKNQVQKLPELQKMETCVLFADISGFTMLGEACAKQGVRGNEELAFCINRYMEGMVKTLGKYGGDIIKFVGDALIVMWPEEKGPDGPATIVRKAIQCCLDIQKELNNFQVITNVSPLSVKLGIGYGECALLYVGGVFGRAEFFTIGTALVYALRSEAQATAGGQILVSETAFKYVRKLYSATEKISEPDLDHHNPGGEKFYQIRDLIGEGIKTRADALVLRSNISNETYIKISQQLRGCLPAAIIPYLQIGAEQYGSETRSLTVMFASLGIELSSASKEDGMQKIQKIFQCVQECVYRQGGSLNKLVMDDKGSTLVCLWGLSPMAHEDDASRAILTAFNMRKELRRKFNTSCNIGISSGEMFSGVVGTSGGRKEFSVLGDVANLAARIMYFPIARHLQDKINVDFTTRTLAANQFSFVYGGHYEFKGKSISIPIFEPIESHEELSEITKKMMMPGAYLKPHMNPMNLERQTNSTHVKSRMCGPAQEAVNDLVKEIIEYFQGQGSKPYLAAVKGEIGSGKTLFGRTLIDQLCSDDDFKQMMRKKNFLFCSTLDAETQYNFLNIWRPILTQLLTFYCTRENIPRQQVIAQLLNMEEGGLQKNVKFTDILCQIFTVEPQQVYNITNGSPLTQAAPINRIYPFVMRENYAEAEQIMSISLNFIKLVLGEIQPQRILDSTPIMIILDSTHLMDAASWDLFDMIKDECQRIGIMLLQRCDDMGELIINGDARETFSQVWHSENMDSLHQIELPCLNEESLYTLLKTFAGKYQHSYIEEVKRMTDIVPDPFSPDKPSIKTKEAGDEWVKRLTGLWQLKESFKDIDRKLIRVILKRCYGNPLLSLAFFVHLLQNSFIQQNAQGKVMSTPKFDECILLNDFLTCPAPRIAIKQNLAMIDKYQHTCQQKTNKRPGELEQVMKSIVMMKAATVLGDFFDSNSLQAMNPLRQVESLPSLNKMLKMLEQEGFIEILDETNHNCKCRFNKPFLRETIYQVVLFRGVKQVTHNAAATYLLQNQIEVVQRSRISHPVVLVEVLKKHMMLAQDCKDEAELSLQARTGLFVKRIENTLDQDPKCMVLNEYIYKQGQAANKKTSSRLCTIDCNYFRWYHNDKELKAGTYLGSVPIQFIYQTVSSRLAWSEKPSFSISTTQWFDKYEQDQGKRDFYFACDNQLQMEKWIITIEFLRTKAVYDQYAQKNIPVLFPLRTGQKLNRREERVDHSEELLFDFGQQLKQNTQLRFTQNNNNLNQSARQAPDLVSKLRALYGIGIVSFSHHLQQSAAKVTVKQQSAKLGQLPKQMAFKMMNQDSGSVLHENKTSVYTSFRSDNLQNDETQKSQQSQSIVDRIYDRRRSSAVSADHVTAVAAQELTNIQYLKNELIHEVSEGQTSDQSTQRLKKQHMHQRRSQMIMQHDMSKLQPDSITQSEYVREQPSPTSTNAPSQTRLDRQTFAPDADAPILFNQDDRLDHLRNMQPPVKQLMPPQIPEADLKNLHQFISHSIAQGVEKLIEQNEQIVNSQKLELSQMIVKTHQQIQKSFETPIKSLQQDSSFCGVTSSKKRAMQSAQVQKRRQSDEDVPQSPSISPKRDMYQQQSLSILLKQNSKESAKTIKRFDDQYAFFEEPIQSNSKFSKRGIGICISDSTCQQDASFKIRKGAQIDILEVLPNFKMYRVKHNQRIGLFLMKDFQEQKISPIAQQTKGSFFMDVSQSQQLKQSRINARIIADDNVESKSQNLKMFERLQKKKRRKTLSAQEK